jgi:hypothetical protein
MNIKTSRIAMNVLMVPSNDPKLSRADGRVAL